jgi:O-antigen biosynthesis protein WbqV
MRLYRGLWRYASMQDMVTIVKAVTLAVLIFAVLMFTINRLEGVPRSVLFINWMLLLFMLGGPRFLYRAFKDRTLSWRQTLTSGSKIPVLLIGSGDQAEQFIRDMNRDPAAPYQIAAMVVDDPSQKGRTIHRVPIYHGTDILPFIVRKLERKHLRPQKMIVTDDRLPGPKVRQLLEISDGLGIPLARLPRLSEFKQEFGEGPKIRPIAVEDLLGRSQTVHDRDAMQKLIKGARVLITGAGGTIGSELTRQIAACQPSELVLMELSELHLYNIDREIRAAFPQLKLTVALCNVRDVRHVDAVFSANKPNLVFHAAAIKHVPIAEVNIEEAILTNVFGTRNIAEACQRHGADVMVLISTDKAVNPANVMGATKRLAESFCQALGVEGGSKTKFVTVRFGNVLGSTGSVVPLFKEQLARGGPITVTHPEMTRYFMTVREAVELVLQACVQGVTIQDRPECIFVLDMGQPLRILDLALQMIRLAGLKPYEDIKITYIGLRPGEKLYEELFHFSENAVKTAHEGIFLASPRFTDMATLRQAFDPLFSVCAERKAAEALELLKQLVPEFKPSAVPLYP